MATATTNGRISQVIGSTFDAEFDEGHLPHIYNALKVVGDVKGVKINLTVARSSTTPRRQSGARCVALGSTSRAWCGVHAGGDRDTGNPVSVPVGKAALGRVFNLLGDPIDGRGPVHTEERWPIHRDPPSFESLSAKTEQFEPGLKVIDLLTPFVRGGKRSASSARWARQDGHLDRADRPHRHGMHSGFSAFAGVGERNLASARATTSLASRCKEAKVGSTGQVGHRQHGHVLRLQI